MMTVTLQIGNSDDKLSQIEWSAFHWEIASAVLAFGRVHFTANSVGSEPWQNACWVIEIEEGKAAKLRKNVAAIRAKHRQDSVAWTEGVTVFV